MKTCPLFTSLSATVLLAANAHAAPVKQHPLMREFMGINAHTIQFMPELYAPVCRLVRDYHPLVWDIEAKSSNATTFPLSREHINWKDDSGKFRDWSGRVDWNVLYANWIEHGFEIDACVQFGGFTIDKWDAPEKNAYRYGKAFAEYFGPSGKHKLVTSAEIGNEPAGQKRFPGKDYMTLFKAMAKGMREGDPALKIVTCAAAAPEADPYCHDLTLFRDEGKLYDVINLHYYTLMEGWPTWRRSHPEHPKFGYQAGITKVQSIYPERSSKRSACPRQRTRIRPSNSHKPRTAASPPRSASTRCIFGFASERH